MLANLLQDVRYSLHGFALRPMFAIVVVLTLAIGIGVNVAVFSIFDRLMLRELNVQNPRELVNVVAPGPRAGNQITNQQGTRDETFSYPMFRDLERAGEPYVDLAASRIVVAALGRDGSAAPGSVVLVSGGYFAALGVGPEIGRVLGEPDLADAPAAVVLSFDYWTTAFGADPAVVGRTLVVSGQPLTIVGVAPQGFVGTTPGARPDVFAPLTLEWLPLRLRTPLLEDRFFSYVYLFGRLKPGIAPEQAQEVLNTTFRAMVNEVEAPVVASRDSNADVEAYRAMTLSLVPGARGQSQEPQRAQTPLTVFFAASATILLLGCVNLVNLMFARGAARLGEIAVRASLGAARRRLVSLLAVEALLLASFAALASLAVAFGVLRAIDALQPPDLSTGGVGVDVRAVAAAFAIAALATIVFALLPISKLVVTDAVRALQGNSARAFGGRNLGRFRFGLATSQIALSMLLLVLAALFTQSLANIARVDLGLRTESIVAFRVQPSLNGYSVERQRQTLDAIERELQSEPGVTNVGTAMVALLAGSQWGTSVFAASFEPAQPSDEIVNANQIDTGFLATLGIPLLAGRNFTDADTLDRPLVAIVNESFVKRFGLGANPIGERVSFESREQLDVEVVGLVADAAYDSVKSAFPAQIMTPRGQARALNNGAMFYVRSEQPPETMLAAIPRIVARADPSVSMMEASTLSSQVRRNVRTDWLLLTLSGTLAVVATLLAALGLYGVLSYMVAQRTREIGLRLALGAEPAGVRRMVLKQVGWMAGVGVPAGIVAALLIGNLAASLLFGLTPSDPRAMVAAIALIGVAVFAASYWPARRASRIDPVVALRAE
jgi:putative ABC transport system permease protein